MRLNISTNYQYNVDTYHEAIANELFKLLICSSQATCINFAIKNTEFETMLQVFDSCIDKLEDDKNYESAFFIVRQKEIFIKFCSKDDLNNVSFEQFNKTCEELKNTRLHLINLSDILIRKFHDDKMRRNPRNGLNKIKRIAQKQFCEQLVKYFKTGLDTIFLNNFHFMFQLLRSEDIPKEFIQGVSMSEHSDDGDISLIKKYIQTLNDICKNTMCNEEETTDKTRVTDNIEYPNMVAYSSDSSNKKSMILDSNNQLGSNLPNTTLQTQVTDLSSNALEILREFDEILNEKLASNSVEPQPSTSKASSHQSYAFQPPSQNLQHSNNNATLLDTPQILHTKENLKCEILKSQRDKDKLVYKGYMYVKHRENSWRCDQRNKGSINCNVSVKTKFENGSYYIVEGSDKEHSHDADLSRYEKQKSDGKIKSFAKSIASKGKPTGKVIKAVAGKYSQKVIDKTGVKEKSLKRKIQRARKGKNIANCIKLEKEKRNN